MLHLANMTEIQEQTLLRYLILILLGMVAQQ
nr:MAG TPA: hypothetical protein [Caudoviricetes sp.]